MKMNFAECKEIQNRLYAMKDIIIKFENTIEVRKGLDIAIKALEMIL